MEWTIDYQEDGVVRVKTTGYADWEQNKKMCEEGLAVGRKHGSHRFLIDQRGIKSVLSVLQVDSLPATLKQIGVTSEDKVAVVFDPASKLDETFKFFRNTAFLESLSVKLFTDADEAIAWLKSEK
jgi:hypothetical protein